MGKWVTRRRGRWACAGGVIAVALAAAGCGSSASSTASASGGAATSASTSRSTAAASTTSSPPASGSPGTATIKLVGSPLGKILVDSQGRTLYLWEADKGTKSACTGACAGAWPPLTVSGKPTAGPGLSAAKLGTTHRSDGTTQVTYGGHPLYRFVADTAPGQDHGQGNDGFGAKWYVVSATGDAVTASVSAAATSASTSNSSSSAAGY